MTQRYGIETEIDKSIDTLATSLAKCDYNKLTDKCDVAQCETCGTREMQEHIYATFSDLDRLAVDNLHTDKLTAMGAVYYRSGARKYNTKENVHYAFCVLLIPITIIIFISVLVFMFTGAAYPVKSLDSYQRYRFVGESLELEPYRKNIYDCLLETNKVICDVNNDGEINCQDWSLTFYAIWNTSGYTNNTVALVINNNPATGMYHMFIAVRYTTMTKQWEFIEPQAFKDGDCSKSYFMEDYWGNKYNPVFNIICTEFLYDKYFIEKRRKM